MRLLILALLSFVFFPGSALGCSCSDVTPRFCKLSPNPIEYIFVGTVANVENPPKEGDQRGGTARYHFRVDERLSMPVRTEVDVLSGRGGADCSIWFEKGIPYLVFAYRGNDGELWANVCSNTRKVADAGPLLAQLRAMRDGKPVARVYGIVRQVQQPYEGTFHKNFDAPLPQIVLRLESSKKTVTTKTADDGSFAVYDVPPGNYKITANVSANLEIAQTILSDPPPPLRLDAHSCVEHDVEVLPTGRIRGQLIGNDGKPLGNAGVELFSVGQYREDAPGWWEYADDKKKYFEFDHVAPGEYLLVFNQIKRLDTDVPYPRTFFPSAPDPLQAERIHVGPGEQLLHTDIHLTGGAVTRKIGVRVLFSGGDQPTSSWLSVTGSKGEYVSPSALQENLYELNILPDSEYRITAHTISCNPETVSQTLRFVGNSAPQELTITVPNTKCRPLPHESRRSGN